MASITLFVFLLCLNWHGVTCQKHETAPIPDIMYGTAWKKERTAELVVSAVVHGFRAIDTAGQPKHYYEPGVGVALDFLYRNNVVKRSDLFLQTKYSPNYTPPEGDVGPTYVPYDPRASLEDQIRQSIASSLQNLRTNYLDSLVLHSPMGSVQETIRVWRVFEEYHQNGVILSLGISNCYDSNHLQQLYDAAAVKPRFIQNRFYKDSGYDTQIREFGGIHNIKYQSFWTLGANRNILERLVMSVALALLLLLHTSD